jgi:hypothetical protein
MKAVELAPRDRFAASKPAQDSRKHAILKLLNLEDTVTQATLRLRD